MGDRQHESDPIKPFLRLKNDAGTENIYYSFSYEGIPNDFKTVALRELNETEENKRKGILRLREFLKSNDISGVEDHKLLTVLRTCKFDIENSEKKLMKYLQVESSCIEWLQKADLKRLENLFSDSGIGILPYRDKHGRIIFFTNPYYADLNLYDVEDAALLGFCLLLYALSFPLTTIAGISYIGECRSSSQSILYPIMKVFRKSVSTILRFPLRIRRIEVINENFLIRWGYNIMRPLIPSKIVQRIQFYGSDIEGLQEFYHPAILPEEFGGTMGPMNPKLIKEDVFNFVKRLKSRNPLL